MSKAAVELRKVSWILLFNDLPPLYCHLKMNGSRDLFVGRSTKVHPYRSQWRRTLVAMFTKGKRDKREFCNSDLLGQDPAVRQELTAQQEFLNTLVSLKV